MKVQTQSIPRFMGLNTASDPVRLPPGWLTVADNVDVTDTGALIRRQGRELIASGAFTGIYSTIDRARLYVVDGGQIKSIAPDMSMTVLASGLMSLPMHWAEINGRVFYANGQDYGIIEPDGQVLPWSWEMPGQPVLQATSGAMAPGKYEIACTFILPDGRETGAGDATSIELAADSGLVITQIPQVAGCKTRVYIAPADSTVLQHAFTTTLTAATWNAGPDALGEELVTQGLDPIPSGATLPAAWSGRIWAAQPIAQRDMSVIWGSEPLGFHLFNLRQGFLSVPGQVLMLLAHDTGLIVGTERAIHVWNGATLAQVAGYGVVSGWAGVSDADSKTAYFWSQRGLCRGLPFQNLTDGHLRVDTGKQVGAAVVNHGGFRKFIAATAPSGRVFNARSPPMTIKLSTGLRTAMAGAAGFGATFADGVIHVYSGPQPVSADCARSRARCWASSPRTACRLPSVPPPMAWCSMPLMPAPFPSRAIYGSSPASPTARPAGSA